MAVRTASEVVGKRLLFSIVYARDGGRQQGCGVITAVTDTAMSLLLPDGSEFTLPPNTDFDDGNGGKYTLRDGTVVDKPDFTVVYTVVPPVAD